jgi:multidrug efflux pump subunit AcrA (membrane-fusion protein)
VEIEIPNPDESLAPGMFVRARIQFAEHPDAVTVPLGAVAKRNDRQGVFLVDTATMKVNFVPVTVGIIEGNVAEILDPKLEGSVVTLGQHLLEDGAAILLPGNEPKSGPSAQSAGTPARGTPEARQ